MAYKVVSDYTQNVSTNTNVQVFVRARPPGRGDVDGKALAERFGISSKDPKRIEVKNRTAVGGVGEHAFSFDRVFWTDTAQEEIFSTVCRDQVDHAMRGYNSCAFAYGQTGSGKTHTMFGENVGSVRGMVPRSVEYLFSQCIPRQRMLLKDVKVEVQFLEIYCGKIRDLGRPYVPNPAAAAAAAPPSPQRGGGGGGSGAHAAPLSPSAALGRLQNTGDVKTSDVYLVQEYRRGETFARGGAGHQGPDTGPRAPHAGGEYLDMDLAIHEDAQGEVFVRDLALVPVAGFDEAMRVVADGLRLRATHETKMNQTSSRSHTVFTLVVTQTDRATGAGTVSKINLVDLAGSERLKKSESEGMRLKEALHINSSLTALGKVVIALDPHAGGSHVPYRDDKLTRILQNSLGGNSYTALVATVHPSEEYLEECLSTLQFANRCRVVQNQPRVTYTGEETAEAKDKRIKTLSEENKVLRRRLVSAGLGDAGEEGSVDPFDMLAGGGPAGFLKGGGTVAGPGSGAMGPRQKAALARAANQMIVKVLAQLGISACLGDDGRVVLPDGRVVGHGVPDEFGGGGGGGDGSGDDESEASGLMGAFDAATGGGGGRGSARDQKRLRALGKEVGRGNTCGVPPPQGGEESKRENGK